MADNEREVVIKVTGKNATAPEFSDVAKGLVDMKDKAEGAAGGTKGLADGLVNAGKSAGETKPKIDGAKLSISGMTELLGPMAGLVSGAFAAREIVSFGAELIDAAGHIADISAKMDVGVEDAQRYAYAVGLSGGTIDDVAKSSVTLSKNLSGGTDSVKSAVNQLGLEFDSLRKMSPKEQLEATVTALKDVPDPADQARLAVELMGRSAEIMLPAIREGMVELGAQAPIMSKDTVDALDAMGDAWTWLKTSVKSQVAEIISEPIVEYRHMMALLSSDTEEAARQSVASAIKIPQAWAASVPQFGATGKALDELLASSQKLNTETETTVAKADAVKARVQALADTLTGKDLNGKVRDLAAAMESANKQGGITDYQFQQIAKQAQDLREKGATLTPVLHDIALGQDILDFNQRKTATSAATLIKTVPGLTRVYLEGKPAVQAFNDRLHDMIELSNNGFGGASLQAIMKYGTEVKHLEAPPAGPWDDFEKRSKYVLDNVEQNVASTVTSLIGHMSHWRSASAEIWGDIQGGIASVLTDIVDDFEHRFLKGLVNSITGAKGGFTAAFSDLFSGGGSVVPTGAGGIASGAASGGSIFSGLGAWAGGAWATAFIGAVSGAAIIYTIASLLSDGVKAPRTLVEGDVTSGYNNTSFVDVTPSNPYPEEGPSMHDDNSGGEGAYNYYVPYATGGIADGRQAAILAERGEKEIVGSETFMKNAITGALDRMGVSAAPPSRSGRGGTPIQNHITIQIDGRKMKAFVTETTATDAALGRLQIPARNVTGRVSRG